MASFAAKQIPLLFLITLLPSILQVQARQSFFFSKFTHLASSQYVVPQTEAPVPAPAPSPMSSDIEARNHNYGLYGREAGSDDLPTATAAVINRNDIFGEKLAGASRYYNNGYFTNNNDGDEEKNVDYNNKNNGYEADERQGMSDTRVMEGGKYYYDIGSGRKPVRNNYEGYYQTTQNFNEFNSMNRFENQQNRFYDEDQEDILP